MGSLSGEDHALTGVIGGLAEGLSNFTDGLNNASILGAQEERNESGAAAGTVVDGTFTDGTVTTVAELNTVMPGAFKYNCSGAFALTQYMGSPSAYIGTVTAEIDIDFTAKTLSGLVQFDVSDVELSQSVSISNEFSEGLGGLAIFSDTDLGLTATLSLMNQDGIVADQAVVSVSYVDSSPGYEANGAGGAVGNLEPAAA
jgi:hypothetical protein